MPSLPVFPRLQMWTLWGAILTHVHKADVLREELQARGAWVPNTVEPPYYPWTVCADTATHGEK